MLIAIGTGIFMGIPALVVGQQEGYVKKLVPPSYSQGSGSEALEAAAVGTGPHAALYVDTGSSIRVLGPSESGPDVAFGEFGDSAGIAVDRRAERIYVSDRESGSISVFRDRFDYPQIGELDGRALPGGEAEDFEPAQLAVDASAGPNRGDLYAVDRRSDSVHRFSADGSYRGQLDAGSTPAGSFDFSDRANANGVAVDGGDGPAAGNVYVVSEEAGDGGTVWAFDEAGRSLWELPGEDGEVCGVAVDSRGMLWVADSGGGAAQYAVGGGTGLPEPTGRTAATGERGCAVAFDERDYLAVAQDFEGDLSTGGSIGVQLATALGFLLVPFAIASTRSAGGRRELFERLGLRGFAPSAFKWMAAAFGAYLLFAMLYSLLILQPEQEDIAKAFGTVPVQILLIAILAPVSEEILFRGFLYGGLRERLSRIPAALIAGVIFGALHALTGLSAVPPLIFFGFVLCLLYEKTGSIWPPILLHMINNSIALLAQ